MSEIGTVGTPDARARARGGSFTIPTVVGRGFDLAVVVGLAVYGFLLRRDGLPTTGLWFDDSWVAAGAVRGDLSSLMVTGTGHPTFTALLMGWNAVGGGSLRSLAYPALLAGILAAPALYLALRHLGFARSVGFLLAAALVVADIHIRYSGRVKGYTIDTLLVLGLAVAVPLLARVRWRWPLAVAWVVAALVLGGFSGYVLVATAVAMVVLVLHPHSDRFVRLAALGVQGAGQLLFYLVAQRSADLAEIEVANERTYDTHMDLHLNPIDFWNESIEHLGRVADIYPGGSGAWLGVLALVAVAGLVIGSVRGRRPTETLPSQFFLLMVAGAFIGSLLHKFPFGPINDPQNVFSSGGRHALWLVPAMAWGLAVILQRVRNLAPVPVGRLLFDLVLVVAAFVIMVEGNQPAGVYPFGGSEQAVRHIEEAVGPGDVVLISSTNSFQFMTSAQVPVEPMPTPDRMVGFIPDYGDPRYNTVGVWGEVPATETAITAAIGDADRVFVLGQPLFANEFKVITSVLIAEGFLPTEEKFGSVVVQVWTR